MMKFFLPIFAILFLNGCISQDQADTKLAKGCTAGIRALLNDGGKEIQTIQKTNFSNERTEGGLHRRVTIDAIEKDGWLELDKTYTCLFMQEWGLFKSSYNAILLQLETDEKLIGQKNGKIMGDIENYTAINLAVDTALNN